MAIRNDDPSVQLTLEEAVRGDNYSNLFRDYALLQRMQATQAAVADAAPEGVTGYNLLTYAANVTLGNTITIGGQVFEFRAASGAVTNNAYVGVVRGATGTLSYAALVAALNATYANNKHPNITNIAVTAPALANSAQKLVASQVVTGADAGSIFVYNADAPGGAKVPGVAPSLAFSDTLTEGINWRFANLNLSTGAGFAPTTKMATLKHSVTAADITLGTIDFPIDFVPSQWNLYTQTSAGLHLALADVTITAATLANGQNVLRVKINNTTGGAYVPLANTNVIMLAVYGS